MADGKVKWFDNKKGFGFIAQDAGQDLFVTSAGIVGGNKFVNFTADSATVVRDRIEDLAHRLKTASTPTDSAYSEFADQFSPKLLSKFIRLGLSVTDASDLVPECISHVITKIESYKPKSGSRFEAWVMQVAKHMCFDWLRKQHPHVPIKEDLPDKENVHEIPEAPEELLRLVKIALDKLKGKDRMIIELRYFGGNFQFGEIAGKLDLKVGTVRAKHSRALSKLKHVLESCSAYQDYIRKP